jgi:hypothetical protein
VPEIYGSWASRRENIVALGTLTTTGSTAAVEVSGSSFTFVHTTTGGNVTVDDEGSLDGASWFSLDEAKSHSESGVHAYFYSPRIVRYVRSTVTAIQGGASATIAMACD